MPTKLDIVIQLLDDLPLPAWIVAKSGEIVHMNHEMHAYFGELEGNPASIVYDAGVTDPDYMQEQGAFKIILIADMPFRMIGTEVDFAEEGRYRVEFFEDIAEQKQQRDSMLDALKKIHRETQIAKSIQNKILPEDKIYDETIAINSFYQPADDLGGDIFDIVRTGEDEFLLYIADVSGHGIQAALITVYLRERVRANADLAKEGSARLLGKLVSDYNSLEMDASLYVTMALCLYNRRRHELSITNAGHGCYPIVVRSNGRVETVPIKGLPVCAIADEDSYEEEIIGMHPGDRLILYTDGIVEEFDVSKGGTFGPEGVRAMAEKYKDYHGRYVAHAIAEEAAKYGLMNAKDDRTIVVADILA